MNKTVTTEVTLRDYNRARQSINGRLARLRNKSRRRRYWEENPDPKDTMSPIAALGVFDEEIDRVERAYEKIQTRLDNAKITIEI